MSLDEHQLLVTGVERGGQRRRRVDPQAGEHLRVRLGHPTRGVPQAVPLGVLTDRQQDLQHGGLDAVQVDRADARTGAPAESLSCPRLRLPTDTAGRCRRVVGSGLRVASSPPAGTRRRPRHGEPVGRRRRRRAAPAGLLMSSAATSRGVRIGGLSLGVRLPKPLYGASGGRLTTRARSAPGRSW